MHDLNPRTLLSDVGTTADGSKLVREMFEKKVFDFPKPLGLAKRLVEIGTSSEGDIVLDFFAGSGTTAHAVMQLNAEDGGNRKWICAQLPEKCKPETEAAKAGFVTSRISRKSASVAPETRSRQRTLTRRSIPALRSSSSTRATSRCGTRRSTG